MRSCPLPADGSDWSLVDRRCQSAARWPAFASVLIVAALLRSWQMRESLWLDELHTAWCVAGSWSDVAPRAAQGHQSPLYFWLVRGVVQVAGLNEPALRTLSLASGVVLVGLMFCTVQHWTGSWLVGCAAAMLLASDRTSVFYGQEARPYALVQLVAFCQALSVLALWLPRASRPTRRGFSRTIGHAAQVTILTALLAYLHYSALLILAGEVVWVGLATACRRIPLDRRQLLLGGGLGIGILASAPLWRAMADVWTSQRLWNETFGFGMWPPPAVLRAAVLYVVAPLLAAFATRFLPRRWADGTPHPVPSLDAGFVVAWLAVPLVLVSTAVITRWLRPVHERYLSAIWPAWMLAAVTLLAGTTRGRGFVLASIAVLAASFGSSGMVAQWQADGRLLGDRQEDWRDAVRELNEAASRPSLPVLLCAGLIEDPLLATRPTPELANYCLFPLRSAYPIQPPERLLVALPTLGAVHLDDDTVAAVRRAGGLWLVVRGGPVTTGERVATVVEALQGLGMKTQWGTQVEYGRLHVLRLKVDTPEGLHSSRVRLPSDSPAAPRLGHNQLRAE